MWSASVYTNNRNNNFTGETLFTGKNYKEYIKLEEKKGIIGLFNGSDNSFSIRLNKIKDNLYI